MKHREAQTENRSALTVSPHGWKNLSVENTQDLGLSVFNRSEGVEQPLSVMKLKIICLILTSCLSSDEELYDPTKKKYPGKITYLLVFKDV